MIFRLARPPVFLRLWRDRATDARTFGTFPTDRGGLAAAIFIMSHFSSTGTNCWFHLLNAAIHMTWWGFAPQWLSLCWVLLWRWFSFEPLLRAGRSGRCFTRTFSSANFPQMARGCLKIRDLRCPIAHWDWTCWRSTSSIKQSDTQRIPRKIPRWFSLGCPFWIFTLNDCILWFEHLKRTKFT